jgi:hypothetical protein
VGTAIISTDFDTHRHGVAILPPTRFKRSNPPPKYAKAWQALPDFRNRTQNQIVGKVPHFSAATFLVPLIEGLHSQQRSSYSSIVTFAAIDPRAWMIAWSEVASKRR